MVVPAILLPLLLLVAPVFPQEDPRCPQDQQCVLQGDCADFQQKKARLGTLSRSSSRRSDLLKELKARICQKNPGGRVCCARQLELPRLGQCGTSGAAFIVGGANTTSGEFPFTALLGYTKRSTIRVRGRILPLDKNRWICGGVLITTRHILTAAHCHTRGSSAALTRARLGEWIVGQTTPDLPDSQDFTLDDSSITIHEGYKRTRTFVANDIALVRLPRPATLNRGVSLACLPAFEGEYRRFFQREDFTFSTPNQVATVVGWGFTEYDPFGFNEQEGTDTEQVPSAIQQQLQVPVLSRQQCEAASSWTLFDEQVCAGGEKGKDSCKGDSGGGLFIRNEEGDPWYLLGLVSYGSRVCGSSVPAVYTRVHSYLPWLLEKLQT